MSRYGSAGRLKQASEQLTRHGQKVDYTGSIFVPSDEVVFYLFEGVSSDAVRTACRCAGLRFERILWSILSRETKPCAP